MNDGSRAPVRRALIIIPGTVNYFHNLSGRESPKLSGIWVFGRSMHAARLH